MKIDIPASALWSKEALESFLKNFRAIGRAEAMDAVADNNAAGKRSVSGGSPGSAPDGLGLINRKA